MPSVSVHQTVTLVTWVIKIEVIFRCEFLLFLVEDVVERIHGEQRHPGDIQSLDDIFRHSRFSCEGVGGGEDVAIIKQSSPRFSIERHARLSVCV